MRIPVAGGGVAAIETVLELAADRVGMSLLAPFDGADRPPVALAESGVESALDRERVVLTAPGDAWTLPLYGPALLSGIVTPEPRPLDVFGQVASEAVEPRIGTFVGGAVPERVVDRALVTHSREHRTSTASPGETAASRSTPTDASTPPSSPPAMPRAALTPPLPFLAVKEHV